MTRLTVVVVVTTSSDPFSPSLRCATRLFTTRIASVIRPPRFVLLVAVVVVTDVLCAALTCDTVARSASLTWEADRFFLRWTEPFFILPPSPRAPCFRLRVCSATRRECDLR